jgi:hypothetical protein
MIRKIMFVSFVLYVGGFVGTAALVNAKTPTTQPKAKKSITAVAASILDSKAKEDLAIQDLQRAGYIRKISLNHPMITIRFDTDKWDSLDRQTKVDFIESMVSWYNRKLRENGMDIEQYIVLQIETDRSPIAAYYAKGAITSVN